MHEQILSRSQAVCIFVLFTLGTVLIHAESTYLYPDGWIATLGVLMPLTPKPNTQPWKKFQEM